MSNVHISLILNTQTMEIHTLKHTKLSSSSMPSNCSTKFRNENSHVSRPSTRVLCRRPPNRSSGGTQKGLQKDSSKDLSRILRTEAAICNIEKKANSTKYNRLWPKAVLEGLDEAIAKNLWETALKIFGLLRLQHWYEPRRQTYTKLLMMLGKCKRPKEATTLFETMLSDGLKPEIAVYTSLLSAYGQSGLLEKAFSTLEDMKSVYDCVPNVYTYTILISCCTKQRRFDMIDRVLEEMSFSGVECNDVTYNTLIHAYGKAGMFEMMESSLNDMIENENCRPDIFTMNSVVGTYGSFGRIEEMERWYSEFGLMGVRPDEQTFNILVRSYGKALMYDKMSSIISFMEERFFPPSVVTFNIVIEVFGSVGDIEAMDEYYKAMKHRGMKPNSITYCSLVSAFGKAGLVEKVDSIVRQVENSDVVLDTPFFNCVISAYGQAGDLKKMSQCFLAMKERKCCPDHITFATMVRAFNAQGMSEVSQDLERVMATKDYSDILKFLPS